MKINFNNVDRTQANRIFDVYEITDTILDDNFKNNSDKRHLGLLLAELTEAHCLTVKQETSIVNALFNHDKKFLEHEIKHSKDFMFIDDVHMLKATNPWMVKNYIRKYLHTTSFND